MQAMDQEHERSLAQLQQDAEAMPQASDQAHQNGHGAGFSSPQEGE